MRLALQVEIKMATEPTLEDILSRHGLEKKDLDRECSCEIRNATAVKLDANWEIFGVCGFNFPLDKLKDIGRENKTQDLCKIALLDAWSKREGKGASYLKLADVLYRQNRRDLVEFLCEKIKINPVRLGSVNVSSKDLPTGNNHQLQPCVSSSASLEQGSYTSIRTSGIEKNG